MVAARFRQMGISAIVVEKNTRLGDNWRKRYPTLALHTPRTHHSCKLLTFLDNWLIRKRITVLYAPFPKNWPLYTPRDKLASWIEQYADTQDLVVWTSSYPLPGPQYDASSRRWSVAINKDGTPVTLRPAHIIVATGTLGDPFIPTIRDVSSFHGVTMHAHSFLGGEGFKGKRVVVVGAGNTSADICQDLVVRGAKSVTMLQRSSTCVISAALVLHNLQMVFPEGQDVDVSDFKADGMPLGLLKKIAKSREMREIENNFDKDMHDGLLRRGLKLNPGADGAGQRFLLFERLGGKGLDQFK